MIPVLSAHALGEPLGPNVAHRVDRVAEVAQTHEGAPITPEHLGRLLGSPHGLLKSTEGRRVVPVINMVDDALLDQLLDCVRYVILHAQPPLAMARFRERAAVAARTAEVRLHDQPALRSERLGREIETDRVARFGAAVRHHDRRQLGARAGRPGEVGRDGRAVARCRFARCHGG